jgi:hypothetical protein
MKKLLTSLALGILVLGSVASAQMTYYGIMDTPGATSTDNWVVVLQTNDVGQISLWFRVKGREPRQEGDCNRTLTATDPGGTADTVLHGTNKSGSWTIKMNIDSAQGITKLWGQDATGQFWIGSLVPRKIIREEPRRNRRTPLKSIY